MLPRMLTPAACLASPRGSALPPTCRAYAYLLRLPALCHPSATLRLPFSDMTCFSRHILSFCFCFSLPHLSYTYTTPWMRLALASSVLYLQQ